jgi:hypothetical protein
MQTDRQRIGGIAGIIRTATNTSSFGLSWACTPARLTIRIHNYYNPEFDTYSEKQLSITDKAK